ncbi:hypothetical protein [Spirosoma koreense]
MITILSAFILAGLSWYLCNNYVRLWNKRFRLTTTHQVLAILSSIMTFFFVLAFGGLKYMRTVTDNIVSFWEANEIKADKNWSNSTFKEAFYKVKALNIEDFSEYISPESGGVKIPANKKLAQETAAKVYAIAASDHFSHDHRFLSKIIWSDPEQSAEKISRDVISYFKVNPGSSYSTEDAINIAAETIKTQLSQQTQRTVTISRVFLIVLYFFVIAIPLGLIGYAAYKDIRIQK